MEWDGRGRLPPPLPHALKGIAHTHAASLVACRADPSGRPVDRSTINAVHIQRHVQAWIHHIPYHERYKFIPLGQISRDLQHAVVPRRTRSSTGTTGSIGTRSKSLPKTIWKPIALAELQPLRSGL
jgi:hypothetical protein